MPAIAPLDSALPVGADRADVGQQLRVGLAERALVRRSRPRTAGASVGVDRRARRLRDGRRAHDREGQGPAGPPAAGRRPGRRSSSVAPAGRACSRPPGGEHRRAARAVDDVRHRSGGRASGPRTGTMSPSGERDAVRRGGRPAPRPGHQQSCRARNLGRVDGTGRAQRHRPRSAYRPRGRDREPAGGREQADPSRDPHVVSLASCLGSGVRSRRPAPSSSGTAEFAGGLSPGRRRRP